MGKQKKPNYFQSLGLRKLDSQQKRSLRDIGISAILTIALYGLYQFAHSKQFIYISPIYIGIAGMIFVAYFIYNKGQAFANYKETDLSENLTVKEKNEFIQEFRKRKEKSKWLMVIMLAFVIVILLDMVELYLLDSMVSTLEFIFG